MGQCDMRESEVEMELSKLTHDQRIYFLSSLSHQLTICSRAAYDGPDAEESNRKLRAFNEISHTVTGQLTHLLADDHRWYQDDDLVGILFEKARNENCESDLIWALNFAFRPLLANPS
jgi:hypothetical protein